MAVCIKLYCSVEWLCQLCRMAVLPYLELDIAVHMINPHKLPY